MKLIAAMLKAIHAQENRAAAQSKAKHVVQALKSMKSRKAVKLVEQYIDETLSVCLVNPLPALV